MFLQDFRFRTKFPFTLDLNPVYSVVKWLLQFYSFDVAFIKNYVIFPPEYCSYIFKNSKKFLVNLSTLFYLYTCFMDICEFAFNGKTKQRNLATTEPT